MITKKLRFEVFKRDSFRCQYCGKSAPDVLLEVDHVHPESKGGSSDILNLITSCFECNRGKSDRLLSDNTVLEKTKDQLESLQERRNQIEMMIKWKEGLSSLSDELVEKLVERLESHLENKKVNDLGRKSLKDWIVRYSFSEVWDVIEEVFLKYPQEQNPFDKIGKFLGYRKLKKEDPTGAKLRWIRGILNNRGVWVNDDFLFGDCRKMVEEDQISLQEIEMVSKVCKNWNDFKSRLESPVE